MSSNLSSRESGSTASIHGRPVLLRSLAATFQQTVINAARPARLAAFLKSWLKHPVEYSASLVHSQVPLATFTELFPEAKQESVTVHSETFSRHGWNVRLHEEIYLAAAVKALKPKQIFEIGTFDGNTTRCLAEAAPEDAIVHTMDLPETAFDATQGPEAFNGSKVGERYRNSSAASKIRQIRADSTTFDFSPYRRSIDFIFVDAAHEYAPGLIDSRNALCMVRPGGVVIWHDFEPYWSGLVHAILEATHGLSLRRLAGTSMAAVRVPTNQPKVVAC